MPTKNYRGAKRPSSSSSYARTITIAVLVSLCVGGAWFFASSSDTVLPSHAITTTRRYAVRFPDRLTSRLSVVEPSTALGDTQGDLPEDAVKGDDEGPQQNNEQSSEEQQRQQQSDDEQQNETNNGEESQQESFHPEIDVGVQKRIGEGDSEGETQSSNPDDGGVGGGGITSQSQIEHDTEGTSEEQQQQQTEESDSKGTTEEQQQQTGSESVSLPEGSQEEVPSEEGKTWATQAAHSVNENARRKEESPEAGSESADGIVDVGEWELCNVTAGPDYIPCLDNEKAIKQLRSFGHFEHRERHCPEESPTCLVPLPEGYKRSIEWPQSRDRIWYNNVPRTKLAEVKGHQNWVKVTGEYLTFPGGGTQFIHGALHYIDFLQKSAPPISWGKTTRVILDVGCGVASFGGYLFDRDVLTMSFAPKDEHEAQVQFALERGIPAISAVMGSQRLQFPSRVFDIVHCARCRVPWHANGGALLLELNRVLRPGGFFVWSATPVYQKLQEDVEIWKAMTSLTKSMCWELYTIQKDRLNGVGAAFYRKPISNDCYNNRENQSPPMCNEDDNPDAAWYIPLQACIHPVPTINSERGSQWPEKWPQRLQVPPYWLNSSQMGVYGKPEPNDFTTDYQHWKNIVTKSYLTGFGIDWSKVRNVMDMRAVYGGFAAALKDLKVWVMNVVNIDSPDTLPVIYERGLFGMYHDWCESFSTYPRTYDLLHADRLFSQLKKRCKILPTVVEIDRIVRPGGKLIVRDESGIVSELETLLKSLHWEIRLTFSKNQEGILCAEKSDWRPEKHSASF
ncbi:putative methyltransferase PMT24 isoform X2 [Iris pallida]|uniref:Methyltransferase PMT24 isoform X2 n=1 Tax=Iris pallida TaxID=29817 RepID=A0AAX6EE29_IRIPA|nr:putative methyltransferase PMT24 isoform X2 [Iris pallida]